VRQAALDQLERQDHWGSPEQLVLLALRERQEHRVQPALLDRLDRLEHKESLER